MHIGRHYRKVFLDYSPHSLTQDPKAQLSTCLLLLLTINLVEELHPAASARINELLKLSLCLHENLFRRGSCPLLSCSL